MPGAFPFSPGPEDNQEFTTGAEEVQELPPSGQPAAEPLSPSLPEAALPPEAQGETNGGPLGCCLGVMVGLVLSLSVVVFGRIYGDALLLILHGYLSITLRILMVIIAIVGAIVFGNFGWKIGKKMYREYEITEPPVLKDRKQQARPKKSAKV